MKPGVALVYVLGLVALSDCLQLKPTNINAIPTIPITIENINTLIVFIGLGISVIIGYRNLLNPKPKLGKRSVGSREALPDDLQAVMDAIYRMDTHGCVQRTVCLLEQNPKSLTSEEMAVVDLFADFAEAAQASNYVNSSSLAFAEEASCQERYASCPLEDDQLQELFDFSLHLTSGPVLFEAH
ncbi:uncharacterized protein [Macrobrachium rosenbergii]|uniref:uncharacterized protein n=1 Tax=Macrobrachium rosenbergii TaxID=79674 RepID=UPI0034D51CE8